MCLHCKINSYPPSIRLMSIMEPTAWSKHDIYCDRKADLGSKLGQVSGYKVNKTILVKIIHVSLESRGVKAIYKQ